MSDSDSDDDIFGGPISGTAAPRGVRSSVRTAVKRAITSVESTTLPSSGLGSLLADIQSASKKQRSLDNAYKGDAAKKEEEVKAKIASLEREAEERELAREASEEQREQAQRERSEMNGGETAEDTALQVCAPFGLSGLLFGAAPASAPKELIRGRAPSGRAARELAGVLQSLRQPRNRLDLIEALQGMYLADLARRAAAKGDADAAACVLDFAVGVALTDPHHEVVAGALRTLCEALDGADGPAAPQWTLGFSVWFDNFATLFRFGASLRAKALGRGAADAGAGAGAGSEAAPRPQNAAAAMVILRACCAAGMCSGWSAGELATAARLSVLCLVDAKTFEVSPQIAGRALCEAIALLAAPACAGAGAGALADDLDGLLAEAARSRELRVAGAEAEEPHDLSEEHLVYASAANLVLRALQGGAEARRVATKLGARVLARLFPGAGGGEGDGKGDGKGEEGEEGEGKGEEGEEGGEGEREGGGNEAVEVLRGFAAQMKEPVDGKRRRDFSRQHQVYLLMDAVAGSAGRALRAVDYRELKEELEKCTIAAATNCNLEDRMWDAKSVASFVASKWDALAQLDAKRQSGIREAFAPPPPAT